MIISGVYRAVPIVIPFFGTTLWIIYIIAIIMGISKACKQEELEIPVIGGIAKSIFSKKIEE